MKWLTKKTTRMIGATPEHWQGAICVADARAYTFDRTVWRLFGKAPVWARDSNFQDIPITDFIAHCTGTRRMEHPA